MGQAAKDARPFSWVKVTDATGAVRSEETQGSLIVRSADGRKHVLGVDSLTAQDGTPVAVQFGLEGPVEGELTLRLEAVPVLIEPTRPANRLPRASAFVGTPPAEPEVIAPDLAALLESAAPDTTLQGLVGLRSLPNFNPSAEVALARLEQNLSNEEIRALRAAKLREYEGLVLELQEPVEKWITARGGRVMERVALGNTLRIAGPPSLFLALGTHPEVRRVEPAREPAVGVGVSGRHVVEGTQTHQFTDNTWDGRRENPDRHSYGNITLGVIALSFEDDVLAFRNGSSTATRIVSGGKWDCSSTCTAVSNMDEGTGGNANHGTWCASIASGDLWDNQDPAVTDPEEKKARSGQSPESGLALISWGPYMSSMGGKLQRSYNKAAQLLVDGVSCSSFNPADSGYDCSGSSSVSTALNDMVRIGDVFAVQLAGNDGHVGSGCKVQDPGGAAYAFTVGGTFPGGSGDVAAIKSAPIWSGSARGNAAYLYGNRTIIDTVAPVFRSTTPYPNGTYANTTNGTSISTPIVAGAFADLRDWWLSIWPSYSVNHAPYSKTMLLLMGDRQKEDGTLASVGFDSVWGAGRLRMRRFDDAGMDSPWAANIGETYVGNNQTVSVSIPGPLPTEVDKLVAVMWWPEPSLPSGADIYMQLRRGCSAPYTYYEDPAYDTKFRVVRTSGVADCWMLQIIGVNIPPNPWLDGQPKKRRVYYGWYYEDTARDDSDGPYPGDDIL